jgi:DNA-binding LacI/PurR family transcriptional regulator
MHDVTIGVLLDEEFDYSIGVLEGIRDFARTRPDWRVLPLPQAAGEGLLTRLVRSGGLQALAGAFMSDRWIENRLPATLPLINTSNLSQVTRICSVTADDAAVGKLVADHFCELGWGRAACIGPCDLCVAVRREGFIAAGHERAYCFPSRTMRAHSDSKTRGRHVWSDCKGRSRSLYERSSGTAVLGGLQSRRTAGVESGGFDRVGDSLAERVISGWI